MTYTSLRSNISYATYLPASHAHHSNPITHRYIPPLFHPNVPTHHSTPLNTTPRTHYPLLLPIAYSQIRYSRHRKQSRTYCPYSAMATTHYITYYLGALFRDGHHQGWPIRSIAAVRPSRVTWHFCGKEIRLQNKPTPPKTHCG